MARLSTHVLDAGSGGGRAGTVVTVHDADGALVGEGTTDGDGRITALADGIARGRYRITWRTGGRFLEAVSVVVAIDEDRNHHVPLLVSDASAVTYLGA